MATKKSSPGSKAPRAKTADSKGNNPAPASTVEAVERPVKPSVQVAASTGKTKPKAKLETATSDPAPKPAGNPRKIEARKSETRQNLVPINLEEEIRRRAYELSLERTPGSGSEAEDWFNAEREIMQRYRQQSA
jgi:hypothetical protein